MTALAIAQELWALSSAARLQVFDGYAEDGWATGLVAPGIAADHQAPLLLATAATGDGRIHCGSTPADLLMLGDVINDPLGPC